MPKTLDEIREAGLKPLRDRLGRAGMIRFLQQFQHGYGDYARERHVWVDQTSLDELQVLARPKRRRRRGRGG